MRVLHVATSMSPHWCGPAIAVQGLAAALAKRGVHCEILTARGGKLGNEHIPTPGVSVHCLDAGPFARVWPAYSARVREFLNAAGRGAFDLVHAHDIWSYPTFAASRAARRRNVPFVLTLHGGLNPWMLSHKALKKRLYRRFVLDGILKSAAAIHAVARAEIDRLADLGYETPAFVVHNGIDPGEFRGPPAAPRLLARYPRLAGAQVILFLGRLHLSKGVTMLARCFGAIAPRFPRSVLLIAGPDDGARAATEQILEKQGLRNRAVFAGLLTGDCKRAALECADLLVLPSLSEVRSLAALEALAAGVPAIVTEQCNFPELREWEAGLVVPPREDAVGEAIIEILENPDLGARMGRRGKDMALKHYTWAAAAESMEARYGALIGRRQLAHGS